MTTSLYRCSVCGRPPHPFDDPQCMPATKPLAIQNAWLIAELQRMRAVRDQGSPALAAVILGALATARRNVPLEDMEDRFGKYTLAQLDQLAPWNICMTVGECLEVERQKARLLDEAIAWVKSWTGAAS